MYRLIGDYLDHTVTPERKTLLVDAVITLEELGHEAALDELNSVMMIRDTTDTVTTLVRINTIVDTAQEMILLQQGITLNPELDLKHKQKLVTLINNLEYYVYPDQAELLFLGDFDNETTFVKLVDLLEGVDDQYLLLEYINNVTDQFIKYVEDLIFTQLLTRGQAKDYDTPISKIKFINNLITKFGKSRFSLAMELIEGGKRVGDKLQTILDTRFTYIGEGFEEFVFELLGLIAISDVHEDLVLKKVEDEINGYYGSPLERKPYLDVLKQIRFELNG